ncbi:uncharacterized protein DFL_008021 [Arthrobotrys flagrans]|uniref:3-phytase n=1 Tax=Arthrobotrys flagrans TaxID=97331 RepID=A0A436ZMJ9_ARTFL|nr:hypothetical protein DFL_008021 [Arthrobotrys flagrans]
MGILLESSFPLGKLRVRWYKATILLLALLFIIANWRRSCISSYSYTDEDNKILYSREDCVSLVVFSANMFILGLVTPMVLLTELATGKPILRQRRCDSPDNGYHCHKDISRSWGPYSPYFSMESTNDANLDRYHHCRVTFANVLSRHGARYPTKGAGEGIKTTINKLQSQATSYSRKTSFIRTFEYTLSSDTLTTFGEQEMYNSGVRFYRRYKSLASDNDPFFRFSAQQRVIDSGEKFTQGFIDEKTKQTGGPVIPFPPPVLIYEGYPFNNTMDHGTCREFETGKFSNVASAAQTGYASVFTKPIIKWLKQEISGVDITPQDTINLMSLCPFYTVAEPNGDPLPEFCDLFSKHEFKSYNYYLSLGKFYGYGPGNPLGPAQGIGYTNELISRLTGTPVNDSTTTNATLDSDSATFPLGRKLYADFSHDNTMTSIFSAMNLFQGIQNLSTIEMEQDSKFNAAELVPFASRMYVEKLQCKDNKKEEFVRVIINDRIMELKACKRDEKGRCTVSAFVDSLRWARDGGNWAECGWPYEGN